MTLQNRIEIVLVLINLVYILVRNPSDLQANETENQRPCDTTGTGFPPQKPTAPDIMMQSAEDEEEVVQSHVCVILSSGKF